MIISSYFASEALETTRQKADLFKGLKEKKKTKQNNKKKTLSTKNPIWQTAFPKVRTFSDKS